MASTYILLKDLQHHLPISSCCWQRKREQSTFTPRWNGSAVDTSIFHLQLISTDVNRAPKRTGQFSPFFHVVTFFRAHTEPVYERVICSLTTTFKKTQLLIKVSHKETLGGATNHRLDSFGLYSMWTMSWHKFHSYIHENGINVFSHLKKRANMQINQTMI